VYHSIQPVSMNFRLTYIHWVAAAEQLGRGDNLGRLATTTAITREGGPCVGSLISLDVLFRCVATGGGISVLYIPPKSVTVLFTCGTLTHVLKLQ